MNLQTLVIERGCVHELQVAKAGVTDRTQLASHFPHELQRGRMSKAKDGLKED